MDIDEFMNLNKPIQRRVVQGSFLNAYRPSDSVVHEPAPKREKLGNDFAKSLKEEQDERLRKSFHVKRESTDNFNCLDGDDDKASTSTSARMKDEQKLYARYSFNNAAFDPDLPIHEFRNNIVRRVKESPVLIIKGETGCGKSTQVPQFILDDAVSRGEYCNIIVTQPRRIAALSLAEQVSHEHQCDLGTLVGCHIGLDRRTSEDTRLTYCTTGVLLQKLVKSKRMNMYTHIILDEIHERDEEMEFLLIAIKRFLIDDPFSTKIILMSATIDTEEFAHYFRLPRKNGGWIEAPSIDLEHSRKYEVDKLYLDDCRSLLEDDIEIEYATPGIDRKMYLLAYMIIELFSKPQSKEVLNGLCILVFLPGIHEIITMQKDLEMERERLRHKGKNYAWNVMPLHSTISSENQRSVFVRAAPNTIKIILSTNIAESSITVPDVKYVIDFCLVRCMEVDPDTGFARLRLKWASRNSCEQRAGRAGRTSHGKCYRLVSKHFFKNEMRKNEVPAMLRCSLEKIVLKAKMLDDDVAPSKIIGLAINPPDLSDIRSTVMNLKEARGLHFNVGTTYVEDDGDLTFLGYVMDTLPIDFRASRLIVLGYIFDVLEECIIIAAGITVQKIFTLNIKDPMKVYTQKLMFADGSGSDLIAILNAYQFFLRKIYDNHFHRDDYRAKAYERYCLDPRGLNEMYQLVTEISNRLEPFNLKPSEGVHRLLLKPREKNTILKVCIAGAFYPNYFVRASSIATSDKEERMFRDLNGLDPCNTVFYRGIGYDDMGVLYENQVKDFFRTNQVVSSGDDVKVTFDKGSKKMFVTFLGKQQLIDCGTTDEKPTSDWVPGKVHTELYKAMKLKYIKQLKIKVMDVPDMARYAQNIGAGRFENGVFIPRNINIKHEDLCCLPDKYTKTIIGRISHIITPNKFWIKPSDTRNELVSHAIRTALDHLRLEQYTDFTDLNGKVVAVFTRNEEARHKNYPRKFHRARVLSSVISNSLHQFQVHLIDEGEVKVVDSSQLFKLEGAWTKGGEVGFQDDNQIYLVDIPPRVFEASLAEIRPSYVTSPVGKWTPDAINIFKNLIAQQDDEFQIEIYSIWNGIASVILYDKHEKERNSINKQLLKVQLAQTCEESYPSKVDHAERYNAQNFLKNEDKCLSTPQNTLDYLKDFYTTHYKPPPIQLCKKTVSLTGPISPLETTIYPTIRTATTQNLSIDQQSVNCILLDTDPQDPCDRLVVASSVSFNAIKKKLTLRNTTIMPNIYGFSQFMAMLFAPKIELHRDISETRYCSLLCGLGYNEKRGSSLYPEHDLILRFDTLMDHDDMKSINKLRYFMSALLHIKPGERVPNLKLADILRLKKDANKTLIQFLQKDRKFIDEPKREVPDDQWGAVKEEELQYVENTQIYGEKAIFPSFTFMQLQPESPDEIERFKYNNIELHAIAFCKAPMKDHIDCLLCSKTLISVSEVTTHIFTKLHKDRAEQCHTKFKPEYFQPQK